MSDAVGQHPSAPRVPGYLLTRPLGRGPQAEVWKALQERTGKWVAVKVFTDKDAFDWEALRANTERLARLDRHPNVVSLLDADLAASPPFFAMDLMEDDSLARRLDSGEAVAPESAVSWLEDAARALAYSPDGRTLWVIGNWMVKPWDLPWVREEVSPPELLRRVEETTGLRLDERGTASAPPLPPAE